MNKQLLEESNQLLINFDKRGGFVPAIVQEIGDGQILMQAYVNQAALKKTLSSGMATFWSTSRDELWTKGETSGDFLKIIEILTDCDQDALVYRVERQGAGACHTRDPDSDSPRRSCFYRRVNLETEQLEFC